ncbi:phage tail tube protein [Malikia sp.]|uniref:phage tail tube protein n=1 Tax=Malikia sp. TaxID=2070706 RepID=UPI002618F122|nr:phage tail tube protein [Malikia sp.]MDD2728173.1 phage tail tube protein [Malikia sp.]
MTSSAISAQGSTLSIGTGTGSAKTITGVAVGFPTIITSTAHGLSEGDVVTLSGLTGADAAALSGQTVSVRNVTANTFAVGLNTVGKTITASGTATPVTWTQLANLKSFSGVDGSAADIEVTNLDSTAKEFISGISNAGQFSFEIDYDGSNAGHIALRSKQSSRATSQFKLVLPNAQAITFAAYVKKFPIQGGIDQIVRTSVSVQITGAVSGL